ncbi:MAG: YceI family protein [Gemmatimonadaceae bacterium]
MLARLFAAAVLVPTLVLTTTPAPGTPASSTPAPAAPSVWTIDNTHSGVGFQIRHFVSKVRGKFKDVKGTITADDSAWQDGVIDVEIATASISTDNDRRDGHLKSPDFFAADSFPVIRFKSTRIERSGDNAKIHGNLTMRGVTRPVVLDGTLTGVMKSTQGDRIGFEASTTVNRVDYGVKWNRAAEAGGAMLGDEVKVEINIEAVRAKS